MLGWPRWLGDRVDMWRDEGVPTGTHNEVIIEFHRIGNAVRVTGVNPESVVEVSIVGPSGPGEEILKRRANRKLEYVLNKRRGGGAAKQ